MRIWLTAAAIIFLLALPGRALELLMVVQQGCVYCEQWDEEIGPIYPKTAESRVAPLRKIDIFDAELERLDLARAVNFTPTFLLMDGTRELDRVEGYPGEDLFWAMLDIVLRKHTDFGGGS